MTPSLLAEIGEALYGPSWQSEMARTLRVASRTVRRWAAGEFCIPDQIQDELAPLVRERRETLKQLLGKLR